MAASSNFKVYCFHTGGRAEILSLLLCWAGKDFEEIVVPSTEWPDIKPAMPLGQLPVLEFEGQKYSQSVAIAAFLAREFDLYGKTNQDGLTIDIIAQTIFDFRTKAMKYNYEKDAKVKDDLAEDLTSNEAPFYLAFLERQLVANGGKFTTGDSVSLGDLLVYDLFKNQLGKFVMPNADKFPNLQRLVDYIDNFEEIKTYKRYRMYQGALTAVRSS